MDEESGLRRLIRAPGPGSARWSCEGAEMVVFAGPRLVLVGLLVLAAQETDNLGM